MWTEQDHSRDPHSNPIPPLQQLHDLPAWSTRFRGAITLCESWLHRVCCKCTIWGSTDFLSPKSLQAPWEIGPASVVIHGVGKALRLGYVRVRSNAWLLVQSVDPSSVSFSGPTEVPKGFLQAAAGHASRRPVSVRAECHGYSTPEPLHNAHSLTPYT